MRLSTTLLLLAISGSLWSQIPCNGEFLTTGDASNMGNCIQLTPNANNQQGCAWLNTPIDFSMPFTHTMTASFGFSDAGADGICLVYQSNGPGICGADGGGIGALGIPNSFIVEFDTWENGPDVADDIPADHSAVNINGDFLNTLNGPAPLGNIEDGANHTITFSWDPASMFYSISFDGMGILSGNFDIIANCFGGNTLVYWGYTSSTGAATNTQIICPVLPPPIVLDAGIENTIPCSSAAFTLNGSVSPFNPNYVFQWSSPDGNIISGSNTLTPQVSGPGTYILTLTDPNGGCMETDQVVISLNPIIAAILPPPFFPCDGSPIFLDGSPSSSGPFISYQWTTSNGLILSGANTTMPMIGAPGFYNLTVTYNDGNGLVCTENETVQVFEDTNFPVAMGTDGVITCDPGFTVLSGLGSSTGNNISYLWSTVEGLIISDETTLFPTVGAPGVYTLLVTNVSNGCFDEVNVVVIGDLTVPNAVAIISGSLNCQNQTLVIDGSSSTQGPNISYEWITSDGNIVSGENSDSPTVNEPGNYTLIVTNTDNGCSDFLDVMVSSNGTGLNADILPSDTLSCLVTSLVLDASASDQGPDLEYTWATSEGNIIADTFSLNPTIDAPGLYYLTIENTSNGCVASDSIEVFEDITVPTVEAGNPQILSCNEDFIELNGSSSADTDLFWFTANGQIISDDTLANIQVDAAGTYYLEATNTENGCSAIDSVLIGLDNDVPSISIIADDSLNCQVTQILIDASASDQGNDFSFTWSTTDGNFVSGENTLQALIDAPGTYNLQITNNSNDCSNDMDWLVVQDTLSPTVNILAPDTLNCTIDQVTIDASTSSQGNLFSYGWSTTDGNIVSGDGGPNPIVDSPGSYFLQITNNQNYCTNMAGIEVTQDTLAPIVSIEAPSTLTCDQTSIDMDATNSSSGPGFSYTWNTTEGNILNGANSLSPNLNAPGDYTLSIENTYNGCIQTETVSVTQNISIPVVDAGEDKTLNCDFPSIQLDGSASSSGVSFSIIWFDDNNNVIDSSNNLSPTINSSGVYILEIEDTENGCSDVDTVLVDENFLTPMSTIALPDELTCTDSLVQLDGSASTSGATIFYSWTTPNGNIFSGSDQAIAQASQAGQYFLTVENSENGCTETDSTFVVQDANFPIANIDPASMLSCAIQQITLQGTAIANSNNLAFQWTTTNGNFVSGSNSLAPIIDQPGQYTIQVTDLDNNCQGMASINILQDTILPVAHAGAPQELNCNFPSLQLDGSATDQGGNFSYNWETNEGNILSGASGLFPQIDASGTYTLTVHNTNNGCRDSAQVLITADFVMPDFEIIPPDTLYCHITSTQITSTTTLDANLSIFGWSTQNGNIQSGENEANLTVDAPGIYQLTLENIKNGCQTIDSIEVFQDIVEPVLQLAAPNILNCNLSNQQLSAQGSDGGHPFLLEWTTTDGNILSGTNSLNPEINEPGTYQLQITNTINGCINAEEVLVEQDTIPPTIQINTPSLLNCNTTQTNLNASNSSSGPDFSAIWTSLGGNILNGQNGLTPLINQPGLYQLTIENTINGCVDSASVEVLQDISRPNIDIQIPETLTCSLESQMLDASNSSSGPLFAYEWATNEGQILSGMDSPNPIISEAGNYTLTIVNLENGCDSSQSIVVQQDISRPTIAIAEPALLNCANNQINLDASASSSGNNFIYEWSTDLGNFIGAADIPTPTIDQPGNYSLQIINTTNGCDTSLTVNVNQDITLPTVQIEAVPELNCAVSTITLDASASDAGANFEIIWSSENGSNINGPTSLTPSVEQPGLYTLSILNTENGCRDSLSIEVHQDISVPEIAIQPPVLLTCTTTEQTLDAGNSSVGPEFEYTWTTTNGQITDGVNSLYPVINEPGTYYLTINNIQNGCDTALNVLVQKDDLPPNLWILPSEQLNCTRTQTILDGSNSSTGPMFEYLWTTMDGNIVSGSNTTNPTVDEPGSYTLLITNTFNGCETSGTMIVTEDIDGPVGMIQEPQLLNCIVQSINLDASNSSLGNALEYTWETPDGNIVNGGSTLMPLIDQPGTYTLSILNTDNLCTDTVSIEVQQDIMPPIAIAGSNFILPCFDDTSQLDGSGSSSGAIFSYQWNSPDGIILLGEQTLNPEIGAPGTYHLQVTNTENGCESQDAVLVTQTIPVAEVSLSQPLCHADPGAIFIENISEGIAPYVFSIDGGDSFFTNPVFSNLSPGDYEVVVEDVNGCRYQDHFEIQQADSAVIIVPKSEIFIKLGDSVQIYTQTNIPENEIASIAWQHDGSLNCDTCLHPIAKPFQTTDYKVFIQNTNGCTDQALVKVFVDKRVDVYIPNAFSPGSSDGFNDRFYIFARPESIREIRSFQVFSRWGEVLYEAFGFQPNDPVYGWDGIYRGQAMNTGVYVYWAEVEMIDGSLVLFKGDVTLIR